MWLIVGLGNPGEEYTRTRHNIGFRVVAHLAERMGARFEDKRAKSRTAEGTLAGQRVALAKPFTFMNLSGQAIVGLSQWYKVPPERVLVIYDDLDLPFGTLRLRERGSAGTHNGMRSTVTLLGTQNFPRLRVGIDRVPPKWDAAKYVLSRFTSDEEAQIPSLLDRASDAVERAVRDGVLAAMNSVNAPESRRTASE